MPTDYLLFNHGVNTRDARPQPTYADPLFELIQRYHTAPGRTLKKISLYWGNVGQVEELRLLHAYQTSSIWQPHMNKDRFSPLLMIDLCYKPMNSLQEEKYQ
jgi:hypothetical protein